MARPVKLYNHSLAPNRHAEVHGMCLSNARVGTLKPIDSLHRHSVAAAAADNRTHAKVQSAEVDWWLCNRRRFRLRQLVRQ
jgi:hypothetical protein